MAFCQSHLRRRQLAILVFGSRLRPRNDEVELASTDSAIDAGSGRGFSKMPSSRQDTMKWKEK